MQVCMLMEFIKKVVIFVCLSVVLKDSVFKIGKNYYPQTFLEDCKYLKKIIR